MTAPAISIIVPTYNLENYIEESIHSILSQTFNDFEIIVIDDGSTDSTPLRVQQIAKEDGRIRLIIQANSGVSAARNRGLDESRAPYIAFVDGDDIIRPEFLSKLYEAIQDADMSVIGVAHFSSKNDWSTRRQLVENHISNREDFLQLYRVFSTGAWEFPNWNKLYRQSIIKGHKLRFHEDLTIGEDQLFNLEYLMHCSSVRTIGAIGYGYRLRPDSAYRRATVHSIWSNHCRAMKATENFLDRLPEKQMQPLKQLFITSPTIHTALPKLLDGLKKQRSNKKASPLPNLIQSLAEAKRSWFNPKGLTLSTAAYWLFSRYSRGYNSPAIQFWTRKIR